MRTRRPAHWPPPTVRRRSLRGSWCPNRRSADSRVGPVSTAQQWFSASRPRTLPAAVAPVLVGTGAGFGVIFVFVFFGLVAVLGTTYVQAGRVSLTATAAAIGIGLLACALLMANNLRDVHTDQVSGKRTLAVLLGEPLSRRVFALTV